MTIKEKLKQEVEAPKRFLDMVKEAPDEFYNQILDRLNEVLEEIEKQEKQNEN